MHQEALEFLACCTDAEKLEFDIKNYVTSKIHSSLCKFYCQIPFRICHCTVVDLRNEEEVVGQLIKFILEGDPDECWISHR